MNDRSEAPPDQLKAAPTQLGPRRDPLRIAALTTVLPPLLYLVVRPHLSADALALAVAGGISVIATVVLVRRRRPLGALSLLSAIGFTLAVVISLGAGGSALPLKLHEAVVTLTIGSVLLLAVFVGRPLPLGRLLRIPSVGTQPDRRLGTMVGSFLVLHALIHVALALVLPTASYLVASRLVSLVLIVVGLVALTSYRRHLQRGALSAG